MALKQGEYPVLATFTSVTGEVWQLSTTAVIPSSSQTSGITLPAQSVRTAGVITPQYSVPGGIDLPSVTGVSSALELTLDNGSITPIDLPAITGVSAAQPVYITTPEALSVTSSPVGNYQVGAEVSVGITGDGSETLSNAAGAIDILTNDGVTLKFIVPDIVLHGNKTINFNTSNTYTISRNSETANFFLTIEPKEFELASEITSIHPNGVYANDVVNIGNHSHFKNITSGVVIDPTDGSYTVSNAGSADYALYDASWSEYATETFEDPDINFSVPPVLEYSTAAPVTTQADDVIPVITLVGGASVDINEGDTYSDVLGTTVTASDNVDGDISNNITITGSVDGNTVGTYTLTYDVADAAGNSAATVTRTVRVVDITLPVITLVGSSTVTHRQGTTYTDAGATANDATDGNLTSSIVTTGTVDINTPDTYTITYNVSDTSGNAATQVTRTVVVEAIVVDTTAPVITLLGQSTVTHAQGSNYSDAGATATDNIDGDITGNIVVSGSVNSNAIGAYAISYNVSDAAGNPALQVTRTINVTDQTAPVITLIGSQYITVVQNSSYVDQGVTILDEEDLSNVLVVTGSVDVSTPGIYVIRYNVSDSEGNVADEVTRIITVEPLVVSVEDLTLSNFKKYFGFIAGETTDDLGWSHRSFEDDVNLTEFGSINNTSEAYLYGQKVLGLGVSKSSINLDSELNGYLLLADDASSDSINNHIDPARPVIERINIYSRVGNANVFDIKTGQVIPDVTMDFSEAIESNGSLVNRMDTKRDLVYTSARIASEEWGKLIDGQAYIAEIEINQQLLKASYVSQPVNRFHSKPLREPVFEVELIRVEPSSAIVFYQKSNDIEVNISYKGKPVNLSQFSRFVLTIDEIVIDSIQEPNLIKLGSGDGSIRLTLKDKLSIEGKKDTQLIGYSSSHVDGIVIWDKNLSRASFAVKVFTL